MSPSWKLLRILGTSSEFTYLTNHFHLPTCSRKAENLWSQTIAHSKRSIEVGHVVDMKWWALHSQSATGRVCMFCFSIQSSETEPFASYSSQITNQIPCKNVRETSTFAKVQVLVGTSRDRGATWLVEVRFIVLLELKSKYAPKRQNSKRLMVFIPHLFTACILSFWGDLIKSFHQSSGSSIKYGCFWQWVGSNLVENTNNPQVPCTVLEKSMLQISSIESINHSTFTRFVHISLHVSYFTKLLGMIRCVCFFCSLKKYPKKSQCDFMSSSPSHLWCTLLASIRRLKTAAGPWESMIIGLIKLMNVTQLKVWQKIWLAHFFRSMSWVGWAFAPVQSKIGGLRNWPVSLEACSIRPKHE